MDSCESSAIRNECRVSREIYDFISFSQSHLYRLSIDYSYFIIQLNRFNLIRSIYDSTQFFNFIALIKDSKDS